MMKLPMMKLLLATTTLLAIAGIASALELPIPTSGYDGDWQTTFGVNIKQGGGEHNDVMRAVMIHSSEPTNVLYPGEPTNFDDAFGLCPSDAMRQKLNRMDILIENWHTLMPLKEQDRSVVKKGKESDEASSTMRRTTPTASRQTSRSAKRKPSNWGSTSTKRRAGSKDWTAFTRRAGFNDVSICRQRPSHRPAKRTLKPGCSNGLCLTSV